MLETVNARLSIGARLALIGALFLVPIVLLTYLFVRQSTQDMDFATREIDGTRYIAQIWPGFLRMAANGAPDAAPLPERARYDGEFGTQDSSKAYADATDLSAKLDAGKGLIGDVADKSNLTLDPDLDSFYAMDAATVRLPGIVVAAIALKQAYEEPANQPSRLVDIAFATSHLETSTDDALGSLGSAMKNNAAGLTAKALSAKTDAMKASADAARARGRALLTGGEAADLNASVVEAARAGEAGRGFAVVAAEVRALAQRSADAAREIKGLIHASATEVSGGVELVQRAGAAFERLKTQIGEIDAGIAEITGQTLDQTNILDQFNQAVREIDQSSQQNLEVSRETTAACQALSGESAKLSAMTARFRLAEARAPSRMGARAA